MGAVVLSHFAGIPTCVGHMELNKVLNVDVGMMVKLRSVLAMFSQLDAFPNPNYFTVWPGCPLRGTCTDKVSK